VATGLVALALLTSAATGVFALSQWNSGDSNAASEASDGALPDPLSVLGARSPGERDAGALFDTKPWLFDAAESKPTAPWERVLGNFRHRPEPVPIGDLPDLASQAAPLAFEEPFLPQDLLGGSDAPPGFNSGNLPTISPPSLRAPITPTAPPCCGVDVPASPVPEPSTWLMYVFGMMAAGSQLRRGKRSPSRLVPARAR
jgi:hypothetical protein